MNYGYSWKATMCRSCDGFIYPKKSIIALVLEWPSPQLPFSRESLVPEYNDNLRLDINGSKVTRFRFCFHSSLLPPPLSTLFCFWPTELVGFHYAGPVAHPGTTDVVIIVSWASIGAWQEEGGRDLGRGVAERERERERQNGNIGEANLRK